MQHAAKLTASSLPCMLQLFALVRPATKASSVLLERASNKPLVRESAYICRDTGAILPADEAQRKRRFKLSSGNTARFPEVGPGTWLLLRAAQSECRQRNHSTHRRVGCHQAAVSTVAQASAQLCTTLCAECTLTHTARTPIWMWLPLGSGPSHTLALH
jgi:hypothetical protein